MGRSNLAQPKKPAPDHTADSWLLDNHGMARGLGDAAGLTGGISCLKSPLNILNFVKRIQTRINNCSTELLLATYLKIPDHLIILFYRTRGHEVKQHLHSKKGTL